MSRDQFNQYPTQSYGSVGNDEGERSHPSYLDSGYMNYDELCEEISKKIYLINNGASKLEKNSQLLGTARDSKDVRDKIHEASKSNGRIIADTMTLLKRASLSRQTDKVKRVRLDRLTSQFTESVERFTKLQKSAAEKVRMTGDVKEHAQTFMEENYSERVALLEEERVSQLQKQEDEIDDDLELISEREDRIRQLEADVLDVNEIFRELGTMIHEQGATIDLIESNVDTAYSRVEEGTSQLNRASTYQKKARKKMCICLIILLVVAIIISIVLAVELH